MNKFLQKIKGSFHILFSKFEMEKKTENTFEEIFLKEKTDFKG